MTSNLAINKSINPYYQGITNTKLMGLVYDSGLGAKLNLKGSTLLVLNALCFHWNTIRQDSFPSQQLIASKTRLSVISVKRGIKELLDKGIILKVNSSHNNNNKNKYCFTQKFFKLINLIFSQDQNDTSRYQNDTRRYQNDTFYIEHEKQNMRTKTSSCTKTSEVQSNPASNDDVSLKTTNITEYKQVLNKLDTRGYVGTKKAIKKIELKNDDESFKKTEPKQAKTTNITEYKQVLDKLNTWGYIGAKKAIKKIGLKKTQDLIKLVEKENANNKGAYLRTLINTPGVMPYQKENSLSKASKCMENKRSSKTPNPKESYIPVRGESSYTMEIKESKILTKDERMQILKENAPGLYNKIARSKKETLKSYCYDE